MQEPDFDITTVTTIQAGNKLDGAEELNRKLNEELSLSDYGSGIDQLFIVYAVNAPGKEEALREVKYDAEDQLLQLVLTLPYREVLRSSAEEVQRRMEEMLVAAAEALPPEVKIPDFDSKGFAVGLKDLFKVEDGDEQLNR